MLNVEERVKLEGVEYEVKRLHAGEGGICCDKCDLKNCSQNRDLDAIKAKHFALSCHDLMPPRGYFKLVGKTRRSKH